MGGGLLHPPFNYDKSAFYEKNNNILMSMKKSHLRRQVGIYEKYSDGFRYKKKINEEEKESPIFSVSFFNKQI